MNGDNGEITAGVVELTAADGHTLAAFRATPADARGGLVIVQEVFGITDQLKMVVRSFAEDGYDTIIPALFDRKERGTVLPFSEGKTGVELAFSIDPADNLADIQAAGNEVAGGSAASVLGYCFGGGVAFKAAIELDLTCAISYYGTKLEPLLDAAPKCPMLFHFGESDQFSPPELIEKVRAACPDAVIYTYDAGHAFANDAREDVYVPGAADQARTRTLAFLAEHHGG